MVTTSSRPFGGGTATNFNPKVHLKNYPTFDKLESRLEEFMDEVAEELKQEFLDEAAEQTEELIHEIGTQIAQEQGKLTEQQAAKQAKKELDRVKENILITVFEDRKTNEKKFNEIQQKAIPEAVAKLQNLVQRDNSNLVGQLERVKEEMVEEMKKYHYRMDVFEGSVQTVLTKFKRLQGDWLIRKEKFDQESQRSSLLSDAIRFEQMVQSKAISTLVELEFIQQSLDF